MKFRRHSTSTRRSGRCLVILAVCAAIFVVVVGVIAFFTWRWVRAQVDLYTATAPVALPKATISDAEYKTLEQRVQEFKDALDKGTASAPLILDERDLNAYLERAYPKEIGDKVYLHLDGSQVKGQVSYPLDEFKSSLVKGRYLNANVTLSVSMQDGQLQVFARQIDVNGKSPPESFMAGLAEQNLAKDAAKDPKDAAALAKIGNLKIADSKLTVQAAAAKTP
jgi:hypothetical protein